MICWGCDTPVGHGSRWHALGAAAYLLWGLFPAFFQLLGSATPVEVLAHRVLWTLVLMAEFYRCPRLGCAQSLPLRVWAMVGAAAALIAVNWGLFIYATRSTTWSKSRSATTSGRS